MVTNKKEYMKEYNKNAYHTDPKVRKKHIARAGLRMKALTILSQRHPTEFQYILGQLKNESTNG